ncbi:ABC transporter ATP-binding protein/permease [Candidatus Saccharibacteria bacterium]|nr:ABC transporter ATP-binding protein/permease [Candidatus Saccharibacteria bacterium]
MLVLRNITKVYRTGALKQTALKNVSLDFPDRDFVSILGPSGSGKTTLLNIIGGLDHYTSGDLTIDGVSTKRYKSSDWDAYRNHRIGFVFQSYNLISHQSILNNVRLALTLSGISKREGNRRAKKALKDVGLEDQIHKRPAQLSGGQMQRVAIARALVNDPDILLADEPTGALDSETSVQIMELLKNIATEKLVIMVTHNPDLAKKYSTRIINLKDGTIEHDSSLSDKRQSSARKSSKLIKSAPKHKTKKTKMSFLTALGLSFNNLRTKKGRTLLVAFAGSIGIIGIALILAVSTGFQNYVDSIQADALESYPLMITEESFSLANLMDEGTYDEEKSNSSLRDASGKDLAEYPVLTRMLKTVATNDLKSFKQHYDAHAEDLKNDLKSVTVGYNIDPLVYSVDATDKIAKLNPSDAFSPLLSGSMGSLMSSFGSSTALYTRMVNTPETLAEKYEVLAGRWSENYDEIVINLGVKGTISDLLAYELGLKDTAKLSKLVQSLMSGETVEINDDPLLLNYEDLLNLDLRVLLPSDLYKYNEKYDVYEDMSGDADFVKDVYEHKSLKLKVVGVITAKEGTTVEALEQGVNYQSSLIDYIIDHSKDTEVVKRQLENPERNVFTGKKFDEESSFDYGFDDLVSVDEAKLADVFNVTINETALAAEVEKSMTEISNSISIDPTPAKTAFSNTFDSLVPLFAEKLARYDAENPDTPLSSETSTETLDALVTEFLSEYDPGALLAALENDYVLPADVFRETFKGFFSSLLSAYLPLKDFGVSFADVAGGAKSSELYLAAETEIANAMTEAKIKKSVLEQVGSLVTVVSNTFAKSFNIDPTAFSSAFSLNFSEDELMRVMDAMLNGQSSATLKTNLSSLGYQDKADPSYFYFYFTSFDAKAHFLDFIKAYNDSVAEDQQITYSDMTGLLMDSVKVIVNAVSYVLIAFVSISLVVSSIMIGIITYISVYERTKEIGILRALGASKRNISSIFNAETFIIGFLSGVFGIAISYLLILPINAFLDHFTSVANLRAFLAPGSALILVILSIVLTLLGGLIPARAASKKDPVEALRTE